MEPTIEGGQFLIFINLLCKGYKFINPRNATLALWAEPQT